MIRPWPYRVVWLYLGSALVGPVGPGFELKSDTLVGPWSDLEWSEVATYVYYDRYAYREHTGIENNIRRSSNYSLINPKKETIPNINPPYLSSLVRF